MATRPDWWDWEIEISPHILKRMIDRHFDEIELRLMMADASGYHADIEPGRWVIETKKNKGPWEVIVEPDLTESVLVVVTAYAVDR